MNPASPDDPLRYFTASELLSRVAEHKVGLCFQDILRCAQRVMPELDVLDPAGSLERILEAPANHPFAAAHAA